MPQAFGPARKPRRGKKKAARANGGAVPDTIDETAQDMDVLVDADSGQAFSSPGDGSIIIPHSDGMVTVDFNPQPERNKDSKFGDNIAESLDDGEMSRITMFLLDGIDEDERDRSEFLQQRSDGLTQLGFKIDRPGGGNVGVTAAAVPGMSTVRDPSLAEAVLRGQANAYAELCPSEGPCKAINYGAETTDADQLAEQFEKDFNYFLTTTASEYYPDTRRMLGMAVYASGMFKKVYKCPLRRRPVSESVDAADLIIPSNVTDLKNAGRITHQINMRQSVMRRMQILGVYRDVQLTRPSPQPNVLAAKEAELAGLALRPDREEDQTYTVYECYCELDIPGFEHKEEGESEPSGLPLPYRVTLDKDSRTILEIRRNWDEDDQDQKAKIPFVAFPYVTGFGGVYGIGLLQIMGNVTMALTALMREGIDAGMYANFPGGLVAQQSTRQLTNDLRVAPGAFAPIDIGMTNDITKAVMPLPYKDVTPGLMSMAQMLREVAARIGGTADSPVGEGKQDAPVGTTLAMIEQATKVMGGVHKAFHAAQREELEQLKELFRDDPEALFRGNKRPALGKDPATRLANFKRVLEDCDIVPASDPNVPSHMHRLAKAASLMQMAGAYAPLFNMPAVLTRVASMMKIDDFQAMLAPAQQAPGPDPLQVAALQLKGQQVQQAGQKMLIDAHDAHADRLSKESVEAMRIAERLVTHPESQPVVNNQLQQMAPLITPAGGAGGKGPPALSGMQAPPPQVAAPPMSGGGSVPSPEDLPPGLTPEEERTAQLVAEIAKFLRDNPQQSDYRMH